MVFNSDRQGREGDGQKHKLEDAVSDLGCPLSQPSGFCRSGPASRPKKDSLLASMFLANDSNIARKDKQDMLDRDPYSLALDPMVPRKRKHVFWLTAGRDYHGGELHDCLLPGLHDDVALEILARTCRSDYPSLACLSRKFKKLIASGYLYRLRRQLGIVENWVYVACSLMPWEAFDPTRQRWMRLPRMPCDDCFACADKESLAVGTKLLVFGRELSGFAIWMFSLTTCDWSRCPLMKLPRCLFGSGSCRNLAIVAGGSNKNGQVLKCAEVYNSELDTWEDLPDMNMPRKMCSGFFMDKKFYVIGGMSSQTDSLTCGEEYNLETRTWRRIPDMYPGGSRATQSPPLVAVVNNQLYAADQATNEVRKYDKKRNAWNFVKPLPVRADSYNGWGLAFKACGDRLLVIGGHRGPKGEAIMLHSWCPDEGNGSADWEVLSIREQAGVFVYNCAVMGC